MVGLRRQRALCFSCSVSAAAAVAPAAAASAAPPPSCFTCGAAAAAGSSSTRPAPALLWWRRANLVGSLACVGCYARVENTLCQSLVGWSSSWRARSRASLPPPPGARAACAQPGAFVCACVVCRVLVCCPPPFRTPSLSCGMQRPARLEPAHSSRRCVSAESRAGHFMHPLAGHGSESRAARRGPAARWLMVVVAAPLIFLCSNVSWITPACPPQHATRGWAAGPAAAGEPD